ncbi:hypothetical protein NLI96_g12937 [Meripilus lineatus]|uniref:Polyprotein n=1 Tax=Meripilus lineatus TaxID=2056292 RepID=A0AAD5Y7R6_9APHY|nr:hypothetical protein NLI96_g12937 [Physisporinus lineatus]
MANDNNISSYRIDSLKGPDHYPVWRVQMQDILTDLGLLKYTDGSEQKPTTDAAAIATWETNDRKALTALRLRISGSMINYVISATTSKQAWDSLAEVFNVQSPMAIVVLRRKMFHKRMEEGTDMEENIRKWREYKEKLALQGDVFDDKQYVLTILTALPPSWDPFIGSVDVSKPSAEIIGRILAEDARRKSGSGTEDALLATTSKSAPKKNFKKKSGKFRTGVVCHYCKKEGHFKSDCRQLKSQSNSNQNSGSSGNKSHLTQGDDYSFHITDGNEIALAASDNADLWLGDCGTQSHIVRDRVNFVSYRGTPGETITGAGKCAALGRGDVKINFILKGRRVSIKLVDAIHAPDMPYNLISFGRLTSAGLTFQGADNYIHIKNGDRLVGIGHKMGNLYSMDVTVPSHAYVSRTARTWYEWHRILGHLNKAQLRDLNSQNLVTGMAVNLSSSLDFDCETCTLAKQARAPFPSESTTRYSHVGELVHMDIWGPARIESLQGNTYIITFTDAYSRHTQIYFLKARSAALDRFKKYQAFVKRQTGRDIKAVRCDNAKEYTEGNFKSYLDGEGILLQSTAPYSPAQNGVAERLNRTLIEHVRAMLLQHDLPKMFWEDAAIYANYLRNLSPTRALKGTTPYEVFFGKKGSVEDLQEFGTNCWVLIPDSKRSKLDAKSEKFTYLGISESGAGYKYFHKPTRQVLTSRNVEFDRIPDPDTVIQPIVPSQPAETSPSLEGEKSTGKGKAKKLPPVVTEPAVTRAKPRLDYHKLHDSGTTRGIPIKDPVKVPLPTSPPPEEPDSPAYSRIE